MRAGRQAVLAALVAAMLSAGATRAARCEVRPAAPPALPTASAALPTTTPARVATPTHRSATPALHTATTARPLHHHARHGALVHRATRRHVAAEIRVHPRVLRTAAGTPAPAAPPAPARESHPRAALLSAQRRGAHLEVQHHAAGLAGRRGAAGSRNRRDRDQQGDDRRPGAVGHGPGNLPPASGASRNRTNS